MKKSLLLLPILFLGCSEDEPLIQVPSVTTTSISDITSSKATGGGNVTFDGNAEITARGVIWSTEMMPTIDLNSKTSDGTGDGMFTSALTNLEPNIQYYVRAYATNSAGTSYGDELNFMTSTALPMVETSDIANITSSTATGGGNISFDGNSEITERGIVWSTATDPTIELTTKTSDGTGSGSFTSSLTGLDPSTQYYVQAYATNIVGTSYGDEVSFQTEPLLIEIWRGQLQHLEGWIGDTTSWSDPLSNFWNESLQTSYGWVLLYDVIKNPDGYSDLPDFNPLTIFLNLDSAVFDNNLGGGAVNYSSTSDFYYDEDSIGFVSTYALGEYFNIEQSSARSIFYGVIIADTLYFTQEELLYRANGELGWHGIRNYKLIKSEN